MASRLGDAAFLAGAIIAIAAFGLLIAAGRGALPVAAPSASPAASAAISFSPLPSIVVPTAPASAPPATSAPPTVAPTPTAAPRTTAPAPLPSRTP